MREAQEEFSLVEKYMGIYGNCPKVYIPEGVFPDWTDVLKLATNSVVNGKLYSMLLFI